VFIVSDTYTGCEGKMYEGAATTEVDEPVVNQVVTMKEPSSSSFVLSSRSTLVPAGDNKMYGMYNNLLHINTKFAVFKRNILFIFFIIKNHFSINISLNTRVMHQLLGKYMLNIEKKLFILFLFILFYLCIFWYKGNARYITLVQVFICLLYCCR